MFDIFNKKEKGKGKETVQKSYQEFVSENLFPMYLMMAIVDKADEIGIESWELREILEFNRNTHTEEVNKQIVKLINRIDETIDDNEFKNLLKVKIVFIVDCGKFNLNGDTLEGTYEKNGINYTLKMELTENGASFNTTHNSLGRTGKYTKTKDNIVIDYGKKEIKIYPNDKFLFNNITEKKVTRLFDKYGYELFNRTTTKEDNYSENTENHKTTLNVPDIMENYTEIEYKWRTNDDSILTRHIKNYVYPDGTKAFIDLKNSDYCYLRDEKVNHDTKKIPFGGNYCGFDKDLFFQYQQGNIKIQKIVENVNSKHYRKTHTYYM